MRMTFKGGVWGSAIAAILITGCSVTGAIKPVASSKSEFEGAVYQGETTVINSPTQGGVEYRVFNQGASSFVSLDANREDAERRAVKFCDQNDKKFRPLRETLSKPPHMLGNFPRVELVFECVEKSMPAGTVTADDRKYQKIATLKRLLDDGALSKEEFEREKAKILDEN